MPLADIFNHKAAIVEAGCGFAVAELDDASDDEDEASEDEEVGEEGEDADEEAPPAEDEAPAAGDRPPVAAGAEGGAKACSKRPRDAPPPCCVAATAAGITCGGSEPAKQPRVASDNGADTPCTKVGAAAGVDRCGAGAAEANDAAVEPAPTVREAAKQGAAEDGECPPMCPGGLPCCRPEESEEEEEGPGRAERVKQLQERLGINLGLEIAIIDEESVGGGEEDGDDGAAGALSPSKPCMHCMHACVHGRMS